MTEKARSGFIALPTSLKVYFVLVALGIVNGLAGLLINPSSQTLFFGLSLEGTAALVVLLVNTLLLPGLVLYALWESEEWSYFFVMAFLVYGILSSVYSLFAIEQIIQLQSAQIPVEAIAISTVIGRVGAVVGILFSGLFLWFTYDNRKHFKQ